MSDDNRLENRTITVFGLLLALCWLNTSATERPSSSEQISKPGQYQGYSQPLFDGWQRTSQYIPMRDGTRIAIDVLRPTPRATSCTRSALPVIWEHRRYHRAVIDPSGKIYSQLDREDHPMRKLVLHGYVFAVADVRGSGASFGTRIDPNSAPGESGCLRHHGMASGPVLVQRSRGHVRDLVRRDRPTDGGRAAPPHLRAVFPEMVMFDLYEFCYPGGIYRHTLMKGWQQQVQGLRPVTRSRRAAPGR